MYSEVGIIPVFKKVPVLRSYCSSLLKTLKLFYYIFVITFKFKGDVSGLKSDAEPGPVFTDWIRIR
jgi:hypothetical protein